MSHCAVTLLASRKPVSSRFHVVCRGSSADSARQNPCEPRSVVPWPIFSKQSLQALFPPSVKASFLTSGAKNMRFTSFC